MPDHLTTTPPPRPECSIPYRLDLAGGWLDQPFVGQHASGPVINCSIYPCDEFEERSGMASSTRRTAQRLWGDALPVDRWDRIAKTLFAVENPPGTVNVAGSQDAIGIVYSGVNHIYYEGKYWPEKITSNSDPDVLDFLEDHLYLVFTGPRPDQFEVLSEQCVTASRVRILAAVANLAWDAMMRLDAINFGLAMTASFNAQVEMFPLMVTPEISDTIELYRGVTLGHKITGAGGGGYVVFFSEKPVDGATRIKIRRG